MIDQKKEILRRRKRLEDVKNFNEAFELVKFAVSLIFDMRRAGLSLILQGMPTGLGAYHILGSNVIALNKSLLGLIERFSKSKEDYNSYLFMVLAHEYLHSFGILSEQKVRQMTVELCRKFFGDQHPSTYLAIDPLSLFPQILESRNLVRKTGFESNFEIVKDFDKANQSYIQ